MDLIDADRKPLAWCDAAGHLVSALMEAARYPQATVPLRQVIERRTAIQSPECPDTLTAMRSQAKLLYDQGSLAEAGALYRRVPEAQERTLTEALALAAQMARGCRDPPVESSLRRTYGEHFQALQAKVAAAASFPTPAPSRVTTAR